MLSFGISCITIILIAFLLVAAFAIGCVGMDLEVTALSGIVRCSSTICLRRSFISPSSRPSRVYALLCVNPCVKRLYKADYLPVLRQPEGRLASSCQSFRSDIVMPEWFGFFPNLHGTEDRWCPLLHFSWPEPLLPNCRNGFVYLPYVNTLKLKKSG